MGRALREKKGSVVVIVALAMGVLLGFAALVVDVGLLYFNRVALSNAADAAALAGVQELPDRPEQAEALAISYAVKNGAEQSRTVATVMPDRYSIAVRISRTVLLGFARVLGFDSVEVRASAKARVGPVSGLFGAAPFFIPDQTFAYGQTYVLKYPGGQGESGNYGALALGSLGARNYEYNIRYGYQGWLHVGDWVDTEPGNMSGPTVRGVQHRISECRHSPSCTFDHFVTDCPRLIMIPVADVEPSEISGRSSVLIVGFAAFFLEGVAEYGNECEVTGKFVRWSTDAELGGEGDYGLVSYRLEE